MKQTDAQKEAAIYQAQRLMRAAGGTRQLAHMLLKSSSVAADVPDKEMGTVGQWRRRGIPTKIMQEHKDVFAALERKLKVKS